MPIPGASAVYIVNAISFLDTHTLVEPLKMQYQASIEASALCLFLAFSTEGHYNLQVMTSVFHKY